MFTCIEIGAINWSACIDLDLVSWPTWIQAVGSVIVIGVAIWLACRDYRRGGRPPHVFTHFGIFVLGCIVGGTVGLVIFKDGISGPWATFAGAGGGAILTVMGLAWLETQKRNEERKRKQRAAIFPLANSLSEVCRYSRDGIHYLMNLQETNSDFNGELSQETLEALTEITEWAEEAESNAAGVIGPKYQLCRSRSTGNAAGPGDDWRFGVICEFAELYALACRLFPFSRGEKKTVATGKFDREEIDGALIDPERGVFEWIEREDVRNFLDRKY